MAHRDISRRRNSPVAFGGKRTLTEPRLQNRILSTTFSKVPELAGFAPSDHRDITLQIPSIRHGPVQSMWIRHVVPGSSFGTSSARISLFQSFRFAFKLGVHIQALGYRGPSSEY